MKKLNLLILCSLAVLLSFGSLSAQRPQSVSINEGWMFKMADEKEWQTINLPHTWNTDAYTHKSYLQGIGQYRRELFIPEDMQGKRLFIKVEAASKTLKLKVNDKSFDMHVGGYNSASYDITDAVRLDGRNFIEMEVDNATNLVPPTSADFTFMGGVYRDVWLIATADQHFSLTDHGAEAVYISTPSVSAQQAELSIRTIVCNDAASTQNLTVRAEVYSPEGTLVGNVSKKVKALANSQNTVDGLSLKIQNPELWTPETPRLYRVLTTILDKKGNVVDQSWHHTGLRWYRFDAENGFFLNGNPYKLRGVCRHQDQKPYGVALTDEQHRRDFRMMKEMGANFLRISHYPQDDALLEMCDREGMLVWEEIPIVNMVPKEDEFADNCESMLIDMMRQHYNSPSVILWGYMNEIFLLSSYGVKDETSTERTLALAKRLEDVLHKEDPYRLSTMAFHGSDIYNTTGISEIPNVVGWNLYDGWYGEDLLGFDRYLANQHKLFPTHPLIVSEYGAGSDARIHSFHPIRFDFSIDYQQIYTEHYVNVIESTPYIMGASYWNMVDFSSASREESMARINNKGILYANRTPKDIYYFFQGTWTKDRPIVHIATRDWTQRTVLETEMTQPVKIYSNQKEVELLLDGKSLGTKQTSNSAVVFDVPMHQGDNVLLAKAGGITDADKVSVEFAPVALANAKDLCLAVNVGSNCYFQSDASQLTWVPEKEYTEGSWGYIGGKSRTTTGEVANTTDGPLYQSMREGMEAFRFDVPDGLYELELFINQKVAQGESSAYLLGRAAEAKTRAVRTKKIIEVKDHQGIVVKVDEKDGNESLAGIVIRSI